MDRDLAAAADAWDGAGGFYLTSGGSTAGAGTLVDAMMRAAGLKNAAPGRGYHSVSLERLLIQPPHLFVLGFFDVAGEVNLRWTHGRNEALDRLIGGRPHIALASSILGCPAWFAAEGAAQIAAASPRFHRVAER